MSVCPFASLSSCFPHWFSFRFRPGLHFFFLLLLSPLRRRGASAGASTLPSPTAVGTAINESGAPFPDLPPPPPPPPPPLSAVSYDPIVDVEISALRHNVNFCGEMEAEAENLCLSCKKTLTKRRETTKGSKSGVAKRATKDKEKMVLKLLSDTTDG